MHRLFKRTHDTESEGTRTLSVLRAAIVRGYRKELAVALFAVAFVVVGSLGFNVYTEQMFFNEGAEHLTTTYKQVASTFELFSNRNWSLLDAWESSLKYASGSDSDEFVWSYYADLKEAWNYSDFYVFNEDNAFRTAEGRLGTADSITAVFDDMYEENAPIASSYIASSGKRKIVFAQPLKKPFVMGGVTYTGVAISYDNEYVEQLVAADVYSNQSDCYVVEQDGSVVFSLEPKTVFTDFVKNVNTYFEKSVTYTRGSAYELEEGLSHEESGSACVRYGKSLYYVVWQPAGIFDWSIVSIVNTAAVDSTLSDVKVVTTIAQFILTAVLFAGAIVILVERYRRRLAREEQERLAAEEKGQMTLQVLRGLSEIADRYAIVDLAAGTYEYYECLLDNSLYARNGRYVDLLEQISHRYAALTEGDNAKMSRLLSPAALKRGLVHKGDRIKVEYASRTEAVYMLMTAVPLVFDEAGTLTRVLLIGQDIGLRKELENEANTDVLTGLFNKRYFANVLRIKQIKKIPFSLIFIDLDRFKPVNDTYGHAAGDELLKQVGSRLQDCVRSGDFAFRVGGDEFAVIVTGALDAVRAEQIKERIRHALCEPYTVAGVQVEVGASCGCASWPREGDDIRDVRALADKRMYEDKRVRRSRYGADAR